MSDTYQDQFVSMASAHIDLANQHHQTAARELVSIALNHAAARYAVFTVAQAEPDRLAADRETILARLLDQYRDMLEQHYDEYMQAAEKA